MRKAWIAAFEAPGDRSVQRSHLLLDHLVRASKSARGFPRGLELSTRILPYGPSFRRTLERALARRPDIVLLLDDTHLEEIRIERVALNRRPSDGALAAPTPLLPGAPAAYFTPLPLEAARRSSSRSGVRLGISSLPQTGVGNAAHFFVLHRARQQHEDAPLVALLGIPIRSQAISLQESARSIVALLRFLVGAKTAQGKQRNVPRPSTGATPVAGRKA